MSETHKIGEVAIQRANASALAENRLANKSTNKFLYIARIKHLSDESKIQIYVLLKQTDWVYGLDFVGYEITVQKLTKLTSYLEALEYAKNSTVKVVNKRIPWARILEVENMSYNK